MANTFKRQLSRSIGNTATKVGSYTVGSSTTSIVIGLTVTNVTGSTVAANVFLNDGAANTNMVVSAPISAGASLVLVGGDQKVVLEEGDSIYVQSSVASSVDVVMSIMEIS